MITSIQSTASTATRPSFFATPLAAAQDAAAKPAQASSTVTISDAGLRLAAQAASQSGSGREQFRITGPVSQTPLKALFQMPDALVQEMATREKEEAVREEVNLRYAYDHQYKPVGQVFVNGQLLAEVNEGGGYGLAHSVRGLSENDLSPKARVEEIARAVKGQGQVEVRYANFAPGFGGWSGPSAPESALPPFTARSRQDIMAEAMGTMAGLKADASAAPGAATS